MSQTKKVLIASAALLVAGTQARHWDPPTNFIMEEPTQIQQKPQHPHRRGPITAERKAEWMKKCVEKHSEAECKQKIADFKKRRQQQQIKPVRPTPKPYYKKVAPQQQTLDEDNGCNGLLGCGGEDAPHMMWYKRQQQQQLAQTFDEEEWEGFVDVNYSGRGGLGVGVGIQHRWEEDEEQKFKLGKALKKAANVIVKANELGLLEEEEWGGEMYGEVSGGSGRPTDWKVGGKITFDEEEAEQKIKIGKVLKTAVKVVKVAGAVGLLEEEMDEEQKFKLGKALKKAANVVVKAKELGLFDEEEWNGEIYGEANGGSGRPTDWKVGGKVTFDEEQGIGGFNPSTIYKPSPTFPTRPILFEEEEDAEQKIKIGKILKKAANIAVKANELGLLEEEQWGGEVYGEANGGSGRPTDWKVGGKITFDEEEEQKFKLGKALKKAANVIVKANELGLLEEEEWGGEMYGEISSQGGQRDWKVGGKITFDEEEAEQKIKIGKVLKSAVKIVTVAAEVGLLEEEMDEEQKFKLGKALKKAANVVVKAKELGLFEEDQEQWGSSIYKPLPTFPTPTGPIFMDEEEWNPLQITPTTYEEEKSKPEPKKGWFSSVKGWFTGSNNKGNSTQTHHPHHHGNSTRPHRPHPHHNSTRVHKLKSQTTKF